MSTLKVVLKKSKGKFRLNELGLSLIYIQYGHSSRTTLFSTGIRLNPKHLNYIDQGKKHIDQNNPISSAQKNYTSNNAVIRKKYQDIEKIKNNLVIQDIDPTIEAVRSEISKRRNDQIQQGEDLLKLFDIYIEEKKPIRAENTIKKFRTSYNHIKNFIEYKNISKLRTHHITIDFYNGLVNYLLEEDLVNNSIGAIIKNFKVFLRDLEKRGYLFNVDFVEFKVFAEDPNVIFLTQKELTTLEKHDFGKRKSLDQVRDIFVLGCYTGLRYSDISRLGKEHIKGNTIKMRAHKNKKPVTIPLTPKVIEILKKYDYQLPRISSQKFNKYVKDACELAEINEPTEEVIYKGGQKTYVKRPKFELISSHKAVSTFISLCGTNGIPARVVSEITGKTVKVIMKHYYGVDEDTIQLEMRRAFGV